MSYTDIPCPCEFLRTNTTDFPFGENDGQDSSSVDSVNRVSFGLLRAYNQRSPSASENTIVSPFGDTSKETLPCSMVLDAGQPANCTGSRATKTRRKCRIGRFRILSPSNRTGAMTEGEELTQRKSARRDRALRVHRFVLRFVLLIVIGPKPQVEDQHTNQYQKDRTKQPHFDNRSLSVDSKKSNVKQCKGDGY
jgi:hypothetical protein